MGGCTYCRDVRIRKTTSLPPRCAPEVAISQEYQVVGADNGAYRIMVHMNSMYLVSTATCPWPAQFAAVPARTTRLCLPERLGGFKYSLPYNGPADMGATVQRPVAVLLRCLRRQTLGMSPSAAQFAGP